MTAMTDVEDSRLTLAELILLTLIASLPLMKPMVAYPLVLTDGLFIVLALALGFDLATGRRRLEWRPGYWLLLLYVAAFIPSLAATPDLHASAVKLASEAYLVGLAGCASVIVDSEARLRRAVLAWLGATGFVTAVAIAALIAFYTGIAPWLLDYAAFHFGTLPPGHYPRLAITFLNANMACNYLTVSLGLLIIAHARQWLSTAAAMGLLGGILIASASTISPGLGGVLLLLGLWPILSPRPWPPLLRVTGLAAGSAAAVVFIVALAVTPILHPTAPFLIHLPGGLTLAPSGRFLCWSAALAEFARHPLIGHGIGIGAVRVHYLDPSGFLQELTDAHNMPLNVAAQGGLFGLAGIALITGYAVRLMRKQATARTALILGVTFLDAWLYQGLGGSFEDARHLWVLLGLLMAAVPFSALSRAGENNRRSAAPSSG